MTAPKVMWRETIAPNGTYPNGGSFCYEAGKPETVSVARYIRDDAPELSALVELLKGWLAVSENCEISDGVCCCGDDMDRHAEPMSCGHVATDHGAYFASGLALDTRSAIAAYEAMK